MFGKILRDDNPPRLSLMLAFGTADAAKMQRRGAKFSRYFINLQWLEAGAVHYAEPG